MLKRSGNDTLQQSRVRGCRCDECTNESGSCWDDGLDRLKVKLQEGRSNNSGFLVHIGRS